MVSAPVVVAAGRFVNVIRRVCVFTNDVLVTFCRVEALKKAQHEHAAGGAIPRPLLPVNRMPMPGLMPTPGMLPQPWAAAQVASSSAAGHVIGIDATMKASLLHLVNSDIVRAASEWAEFKSPEGKPYYFSQVTKQSVWERPAALIELDGQFTDG